MKKLLRYLLGNDKAVKVNAITIDGRPWYMAQNICDFIGITCAHIATTKKHKKSESGMDITAEERRKETIYVVGSDYKKVILVNNKGMIKLIYQAQTSFALSVQHRVETIPQALIPPEWEEYLADAE